MPFKFCNLICSETLLSSSQRILASTRRVTTPSRLQRESRYPNLLPDTLTSFLKRQIIDIWINRSIFHTCSLYLRVGHFDVCDSPRYRSRVRIVLALREMRNPPCWRNQFPLRSEWCSCNIYCIVCALLRAGECWPFESSEHSPVIPHELKPCCLIAHVITFLPAQQSSPKRGIVGIKHKNSTLNFKVTLTLSLLFRDIVFLIVSFRMEILPCTRLVFTNINKKPGSGWSH